VKDLCYKSKTQNMICDFIVFEAPSMVSGIFTNRRVVLQYETLFQYAAQIPNQFLCISTNLIDPEINNYV
jgi:hypothetical protein